MTLAPDVDADGGDVGDDDVLVLANDALMSTL
jgi:hypothetical protein